MNDSIKITKEMVKNGLEQKRIKPILQDNELVCYIGDFWFYFGGFEFENTAPSDINSDILAKEILDALDGLCSDGFDDEYMYYYYYLKECEQS